MKRYLNSKGYALLLVLLFVMVMAVTMAGLSIKMTNNLKQSDQEQNYLSAFYIAEGGAAEVMQQIEDHAGQIAASETNASNFFTKLEQAIVKKHLVTAFEPFDGEQPNAEVRIIKVNNEIPRDYKIISAGKIGKRERIVSGVFTMNFEEGSSGITFPPGLGVYTKTTVNLSGSGHIIGDVIFEKSSSNMLSIKGGSYIDGNVYVPANTPDSYITKNGINKEKIMKFNELDKLDLPDFPSFPSYSYHPDKTVNQYKIINNGEFNATSWQARDYKLKLNGNTAFKSISVGQNNPISLEIGDKAIAIVVEELDLSNGHINIIGSGTLTFYVQRNFNIGAGSSLNLNGNADVYMYIGPSESNVSIGGGQTVNASIYAAKANVSIGAGARYHGVFVTGGSQVDVSGGAQATSKGNSHLIYAPNADVKIKGGGKLNGSVVSKSFEATGGTEIKSTEIDIEDNPIFSGGDKKPGASKIERQPVLKEVQN